MGCAPEDGAKVTPPRREAQAVKAFGDELKSPKANGFAEGEATTCQTFNIGGDDECRRVNHQNV
jgi:hypothetical protein